MDGIVQRDPQTAVLVIKKTLTVLYLHPLPQTIAAQDLAAYRHQMQNKISEDMQI